MSASIASLLALFTTVTIGLYARVNMGILGIAFAFLVGHFILGIKPVDIYSKGFPLRLFFLLLGTTLFSAVARGNGTYSVLARQLTYLSDGNRRLACFLVFAICFAAAVMGMGTIVTAAVLLPLMIEYAKREELPEFLVILLAISGCLAGGLSGIAPTGILAQQLAGEVGITRYWPVFLTSVITFSLHGLVFFLLFGGLRLSRLPRERHEPMILDGKQFFTIIVVFGVVTAIIGFHLDLGLSAFMGAALLLLCGAGDQDKAIAGVDWRTILLLSGVSILFYVIVASGGIDLLRSFLTERIEPRTAGVFASLFAGAMSLTSSSMAVVMPTLIPAIPSIASTVNAGGDHVSILAAIMVGTHTAAYSPISTMGALGLASTTSGEAEKQKLFTKLLFVALAMWILTPWLFLLEINILSAGGGI